MTSPEHLLKLNLVTAGMRLARPVSTQQGRLLLIKGEALDMASIAMLNHSGITELWIDCTTQPSPSLPCDETASTQSNPDRLAQLFRQSSASGGGRELLELVQRYRMRELK